MVGPACPVTRPTTRGLRGGSGPESISRPRTPLPRFPPVVGDDGSQDLRSSLRLSLVILPRHLVVPWPENRPHTRPPKLTGATRAGSGGGKTTPRRCFTRSKGPLGFRRKTCLNFLSLPQDPHHATGGSLDGDLRSLEGPNDHLLVPLHVHYVHPEVKGLLAFRRLTEPGLALVGPRGPPNPYPAAPMRTGCTSRRASRPPKTCNRGPSRGGPSGPARALGSEAVAASSVAVARVDLGVGREPS